MKMTVVALAMTVAGLLAVPTTGAQTSEDQEHAELLPALKDGHPVADVTLVKGEEWKTVSEKLD